MSPPRRGNVRSNRWRDADRGGSTVRGWLSRLGSALGWGALLALVLGLGTIGWYWTSVVTVDRLEVEGTERADVERIRELASVETGALLYEISATALADRVRVHPWVRAVDVDRIPTGLLRLQIEEHVPRALVLDGAGRAAYYLSAAGDALPLAAPAVADVPLVRGLPGRTEDFVRVDHRPLTRLLGALSARSDRLPLVSSIRVGSPEGLRLEVGPDPAGSSVTVVLGQESFDDRLRRLRAFWRQRVQSSDQRFRRIDLRFDGQVVTRQDPFSSTAR